MTFVKASLLSACVLLLSACATGSQKGAQYFYNEIQVINNSSAAIGALSITASASGEVVDCGDIGPLGLCNKRFGRRTWVESPFIVNWSYAGQAPQATEIDIAVPVYNAPGNPLYIAFEISETGEMSARFVQKIPS